MFMCGWCVAGAWPTDLSEKEDDENCSQDQVVPSCSEVAVVRGQSDAAVTLLLCRGAVQCLLCKQSKLVRGGASTVGGASMGGCGQHMYTQRLMLFCGYYFGKVSKLTTVHNMYIIFHSFT